jgi:hypothetical protein
MKRSDFYDLQFIITGTQIELQCKICNGPIEWWHDLATRTRYHLESNEKRLAMR